MKLAALFGVHVALMHLPGLEWDLLVRTRATVIRVDLPMSGDWSQHRKIVDRRYQPLFVLPCDVSGPELARATSTFPHAWWEVCNEPNIAGVEPERYAALISRARPLIRQSGGRLFGPGVGGGDHANLSYFLRLADLGMLGSFDYLALHPYPCAYPEAAKSYFKLFAGFGLQAVATEWSYASPIGEAWQAEYLRRMLETQRREDIGLLVWYQWKDRADEPLDYGLLTRTGRPKLAYSEVLR